MGLNARQRRPELMDQPGIEVGAHRAALDGLGRAHVVSLSVRSLWPSVREAATGRLAGPVRILDVACGGGHVVVALARRCAKEGLPAEIVGCDTSPVAIEYARRLADRAGVSHVLFDKLDALRDPWPGPFDLVISSLFLHHLSEPEATALLRKMGETAGGVAVADLRRTVLGFLFAWVGCRLLSRSPIFHIDGVRSVQAAFSIGEARRLAEGAGLGDASITRRWPQRFVLTWRRARAA